MVFHRFKFAELKYGILYLNETEHSVFLKQNGNIAFHLKKN